MEKKPELPEGEIIDIKDIPPLPTCTCLRCGYTWHNRTEEPKQCPRCKSMYWNKPRRKQK